VLLTSASVAVVMDSGEKAYERYESPALAGHLDEAGDEWMHIHEDRAHLWSKFVYANAVIAGLAIALAVWRPRDAGRYAAGLTLILSLGCVGAMAWVSDAGGKIHHAHFRPAQEAAEPPADAPDDLPAKPPESPDVNHDDNRHDDQAPSVPDDASRIETTVD